MSLEFCNNAKVAFMLRLGNKYFLKNADLYIVYIWPDCLRSTVAFH